MLASREGKLIGLWIEGQKYYLGKLKEEVVERDDEPALVAAREWLDRYFAGERPEIAELELAPIGSEFQQEVWQILRGIPYGATLAYGQIAEMIAARRGLAKMSAQAVGGAVGHNPISIIVPCHRVVGTSGSLTGYAGGIGIKVKLLEHEGVDVGKFTIPGGL